MSLFGLEPWALWVITAILCLIFEMLIPSFVTGSFAMSAFVAAGASAWFGADLVWQLLIFAVFGVLLLIPTRKLARKDAPKLKLGHETFPGKQALCLERIIGELEPGIVQLDGSRWNALTARGLTIEPGQVVEVVRVEGVRLVVEPRSTQSVTAERGVP